MSVKGFARIPDFLVRNTQHNFFIIQKEIIET